MMRKFIAIYLIFAVAIGAILFRDVVVDLFRGMSPLESMKQIVNYMLHIAVLTILGSFLLGLYKVFQGWRRFVRGLVGGKRTVHRSLPARTAAPRKSRKQTDLERLLRLYVLMKRIPPPSSRSSEQQLEGKDRSRLNF